MRNIDLFKSIRLWGRLTVLLPMLTCSCSDEVSDSSSESMYHETKTCEFTVTDYQSFGIDINDGEAISVFSTDVPDENRKFHFKELAFTGEIATTGDYYGIYPYNPTTSFSYTSATPVAKIDIPLKNIANVISDNDGEGSEYANSTSSDVAVTKLSEESIKFNSIYTQLSFNITTEYDYHIEKIEIKGLNGEKLTGFSNVSITSSEPIVEFTDKSNSTALYDCNVTVGKGESISVLLPIVATNFEKGFLIMLYDGESSVQKEYSPLKLNYGSVNSIDDFGLELPEYFVEYKSDVEITLPGYYSEYEGGSGRIYIESNKIPDNMFKGQKDLKEIKISSNIVSVGNSAFAGAENLTSVSFGDVESIYDTENPDLIVNVTTNSILESIGNNAFDKCNVSLFVLPESIKDISNAFAKISKPFKTYILSEIPPLADSDAFSSSLKGMYVPEGSVDAYKAMYPSLKDRIAAIGTDDGTSKYYVQYKSNKALSKVVEGYEHEYDEATKIGYIYFDTPVVPDKLFYQKGESVESITLSTAIEKIGSNSFCQIGTRKELSSFNVEPGSKLREIGYMGVQGNENCEYDLSNATMLEIIGQISFGECYNVMSYNFPNSVKEIQMGAFRNLRWKEVVLNEGLEKLVGNQWNGVFQGCSSIEKLVLPSTLNYIGQNGLKMGYNNNSPQYIVECKAVVPPTVVVDKSFFLTNGTSTSKLKAIYVPDNSVAAYKTAQGWSSWADKIKSISELNN